jgi:ankyrin repeat protein
VIRCYRIGILVLAAVAVLSAADPAPSLIDAVKRGDREAVRALLRTRVDVNAPAADGTTALHYAVEADALDLVTQLMRAGANAKAVNRYGIQPITLAATNGSVKVLESLLEGGADPNTRTEAGEPVLMTAARTGNPAAVSLLIKRGADVNARETWFGETAMMWAASEDHAAVIKALAAAGGDVNARSTVQETPVLEFPRSGGPNSPFPRGGWTALMFAARQGSTASAQALAELGADLNAVALPETDVPLKGDELASITKGVGTSALVFAIINSHFDLAAMLLDKGADPNVADLAGEAALYAAVDMNSIQWTQGRPAPIFTDRLDAVDLVKVLLAKGANPNARLKRAPLKRHHDAGTTLNFGEGATPLMRAARTNDVGAMKALLEGGADPFLTLPDRTTTLMIASGLGYGGLRGEAIRIVVPTPEGAVDAATLLMERGVDVNAFNTAGNTALHGAVGRGEPVVQLLVSRGATLVKNKAGFTPLDLAQGAGGRGGRGGVVREGAATILRRLQPAGAAPVSAAPATVSSPRPSPGPSAAPSAGPSRVAQPAP